MFSFTSFGNCNQPHLCKGWKLCNQNLHWQNIRTQNCKTTKTTETVSKTGFRSSMQKKYLYEMPTHNIPNLCSFCRVPKDDTIILISWPLRLIQCWIYWKLQWICSLIRERLCEHVYRSMYMVHVLHRKQDLPVNMPISLGTGKTYISKRINVKSYLPKCTTMQLRAKN